MNMGQTFDGWYFSHDGSWDGEQSDVAVMGAPFDLNTSHRPGARFGPDAIRTATHFPNQQWWSFAHAQAVNEFKGVDAGDACMQFGNNAHNYSLIGDHARTVLSHTDFLVTLGGDHSIIFPVLDAIVEKYGPVHLIHFDAHHDVWDATIEEGLFSHGSAVRRVIEAELVTGVDTFGLRGLTPGDGAGDSGWAREHNIAWHNADQWPWATLANLPDDKPLYVSVDIDVLDPAFAPGTGTPEPGGLSTRELLYTLGKLGANPRLVGMDVVEVCPPHDFAGLTAMAAHRIILAALAARFIRRDT